VPVSRHRSPVPAIPCITSACPADKQLYLGDGRLVLEAMPDEKLDFLAMDAFTSDAVPMHLLTTEAFRTYSRHLKQDGFLGINISNRYLDLEPIVAQTSSQFGFSGVVVADDTYQESYYTSSTWVIMSRDPKQFEHANFQESYISPLKTRPGFRMWTDDYSNILQILR
jgi:spermidine synthase